MGKVRVNFTMDSALLASVDEAAKMSGISRAAFFAAASADYLKAHKALPDIQKAFGDFFGSMQKLAQGEITPAQFEIEMKRQEKNIERVREVLDA